jgi:hypothetical protein
MAKVEENRGLVVPMACLVAEEMDHYSVGEDSEAVVAGLVLQFGNLDSVHLVAVDLVQHSEHCDSGNVAAVGLV